MDDEGHTNGELARELNMKNPNVSRYTSNLKKRGILYKGIREKPDGNTEYPWYITREIDTLNEKLIKPLIQIDDPLALMKLRYIERSNYFHSMVEEHREKAYGEVRKLEDILTTFDEKNFERIPSSIFEWEWTMKQDKPRKGSNSSRKKKQ